MLDGPRSYMENSRTGQRTKIHYEGGQYVLYLWVPAASSEIHKVKPKGEDGHMYAILAADEEQGFHRPAKA